MLGRIAFLGVVGLGLFVFMSSSGSKAAAKVIVTCSPTDAAPTASASFEWHAPKAGAIETWLDVSLAPSFTAGWFQPHGPFAMDQTKTLLDGLPQGLQFYYRVNTLYPDGWRQTAGGKFSSKCVTAAPNAAQSLAGTAVASGVEHAVQTAIAEKLP